MHYNQLNLQAYFFWYIYIQTKSNFINDVTLSFELLWLTLSFEFLLLRGGQAQHLKRDARHTYVFGNQDLSMLLLFFAINSLQFPVEV